MTKFCVKTNTGMQETLAAMEDLLSHQANLLILAYGYISSGDEVKSYRNKLVEWLQKSEDRQLHIYVGVVASKPSEIEKKKAELQRYFEELLPEALYHEKVTKRIFVYAIYDFHCKFALAVNWVSETQSDAVAGIIGSSNLSNVALTGSTRFEFDLYIDQPGPLLTDFVDRAYELLDLAEKASWNEFSHETRDRIFESPRSKEDWEAIEEARKDELEEELRNRESYLNDGMSEADRAAKIESDIAQGIYTNRKESD